MPSIRPVLRSPFRSPFRSPWDGLYGFSGLLNKYPAGLGLSLQLLRSGHLIEDTDPDSETFGQVRPFVVRARRSSDNAKRCFVPVDFLFGTLTAWTGTAAGNDGFCRDWFDQSGNNRHATQPIALSQPRLVKDGVIEVDDNGKPTMVFDGVDDQLNIAAFDSAFVQPITSFSVHSNAATIGVVYSYDAGSSFYGSLRQHGIFAGSTITITPVATATVTDLKYALLNGASSVLAVNGKNGTTGNAGTNGIASLSIGASGYGENALKGTIGEIIIYASDQSANRAAIEKDIAKRYDIVLA